MLEGKRTRTKILATLGPATGSTAKIRELNRAGVQAIRLNMSHGSHEECAAWIERIKAQRKALNRPVAILLDLRGPRQPPSRLDRDFARP